MERSRAPIAADEPGNQGSEGIHDDSFPQGPVEPGDLEDAGWALGGDALGLLLEKLDPDRDVAAREYERIHERLSRFFEWRGCRPPGQLADEVLDRLAHKLEKGQSVDLPDATPLAYLLGIAHHVAKEVYRRYELEGHHVAEVDSLEAPQEQPSDEERLGQLDHCLSKLKPRDRELLLEYYTGERQYRIENRESMARRLGASLNAFRVRVHRLRQRVEKCMRTRG